MKILKKEEIQEGEHERVGGQGRCSFKSTPLVEEGLKDGGNDQRFQHDKGSQVSRRRTEVSQGSGPCRGALEEQ